jgi:hypothetical protein
VALFDSSKNFAATHKHLPIPLMAVVERHILDESHADACRSREISEVAYLTTIHSANDYTVNFWRRESSGDSSFNAVKHRLQRIATRDGLKGLAL